MQKTLKGVVVCLNVNSPKTMGVWTEKEALLPFIGVGIHSIVSWTAVHGRNRQELGFSK